MKLFAGDIASRFTKTSSKAEEGKMNFALYALRDWDLDRMFDKKGARSLKLNDIRDALLAGDAEKLTDADYQDGLAFIADKLLGRQDGGYGFIDKITLGSQSLYDELKGQRSKFLDDMKELIIYKDAEAERTAIRNFGHDDLGSWIEQDMKRAKSAYAILKKAGSEPMQFFNSLKAMLKTYVSKVAPEKYSREGIEKSLPEWGLLGKTGWTTLSISYVEATHTQLPQV